MYSVLGLWVFPPSTRDGYGLEISFRTQHTTCTTKQTTYLVHHCWLYYLACRFQPIITALMIFIYVSVSVNFIFVSIKNVYHVSTLIDVGMHGWLIALLSPQTNEGTFQLCVFYSWHTLCGTSNKLPTTPISTKVPSVRIQSNQLLSSCNCMVVTMIQSNRRSARSANCDMAMSS